MHGNSQNPQIGRQVNCKSTNLPVFTFSVITLVLRSRNTLYAQTSSTRFFKSKENKYRVLISTLNFTHHNVIDEIIKTLTQREITRSLKKLEML